jgi:hypothetical protein
MSNTRYIPSMETFARLEIIDAKTESNVTVDAVELLFKLMLSEGEEVEVTATAPFRFIASFTNVEPDVLAKRIKDRILSRRDDKDEIWKQWAYICLEALASGAYEIDIDVPQSNVALSYDDIPGFACAFVTEVFGGVDLQAGNLYVLHTTDSKACVVQEGEIIGVCEQDLLLSFGDEQWVLGDYEVGTLLKQVTRCASVYRDGILESTTMIDQDFLPAMPTKQR